MDHDACSAVSFTPALWKQRRSFILDVLKQHKAQKVLDYGCGEGAVLSFLIPPSATDDIHFTHLIGLDIDRNLLEQETFAACQPWPTDYEQLRESPLTVDIYCGSVGKYDTRLKSSACDAIICSEVIEHVYPSTLDACLPLMLGAYALPLAIVTTPNAEYNVFFPDLKYGQLDATFRHDDHKFEWTRREFEEWCTKGAQEYGYDVEFYGIGLLDGKRDQLEYGHCTQACIFTKKQQQPHLRNPPTPPPSDHTTDSPHLLLKRFHFPYYDLPPLPAADIFQHVESYISNLCQAMTLKQQQEEKQRQQQQSIKQGNDDDDDDDDGLDSLITWSTGIDNKDDDHKSFDWNKDDEGSCTTNNHTWCTEYTYDHADADDGKFDDDDNKQHHWDDESSSSNSSDDSIHNDNDSNNHDSEKQQHPLWTTTPITLNLDTLWSVLHIRQLCKTRQRLVEEVLPIGGDAFYKVMGDQLVVHKSFLVEDQPSF